MKIKNIVLFALILSVLSYSSAAFADGCYMCSGGSYVKYSGTDDQTKRKAAQACGCTITGTRGECDAANLTVLCSVKIEKTENVKVAKGK